ncbi:MAG: radical SAM protein [Clostridia bacterium]|nr:radical SAM protein [Clostridia bacterium]
MNNHKNIPVFVPHEGCPNDCVFCNQRKISGKSTFNPDAVSAEIETALSTIKDDTTTEIAFFGGSFTGIERNLMLKLLKIASEYVYSGKVSSIRLSTRPDFIDEEILDILKENCVSTIEIGFQSFSEDVLFATKRGHTLEDSYRSARLIKEYGFNLVGQMMTGLPMSTIEKEEFTALEICRIGAQAARIYPTVVFCDTELKKMAEEGIYTPLSLEESVYSAYRVYKIFLRHNVEVIRCGLCASDNLFDKETVFSGGYHEALGELVESLIFYDLITEKIKEFNGETLYLTVAKGMTSKVVGHKKENKIKLYKNYGIKKLKIDESNQLCGFDVEIKR